MSKSNTSFEKMFQIWQNDVLGPLSRSLVTRSVPALLPTFSLSNQPTYFSLTKFVGTWILLVVRGGCKRLEDECGDVIMRVWPYMIPEDVAHLICVAS